MKSIKLALICLFLLSGTSFSWWSFERVGAPFSTHRRITTGAITLLNTTTDYPDIRLFSQTIIDATSGDINDDIAHGREDRAGAGKFIETCISNVLFTA